MDTRDKQADSAATNFMTPSPTQGPTGAELLDTPASVEDVNGPSGATSIEQRDLTRDAVSIKQKDTSASPLQDSLRRLSRDKRAMVSLIVIVLFLVIPLIGPFIYQHVGGSYTSHVNGLVIGPQIYHDPFHGELDRQDELPSAQYWLGTDSDGRDLLARLMQGRSSTSHLERW